MAYKTLQGFDILQLPSRSLLQSYTGAFLHDLGTSKKCIDDQVAQYVLFKLECQRQGKHVPQSDGVLVFDEVKVTCQLMWNSRNQTLSGNDCRWHVLTDWCLPLAVEASRCCTDQLYPPIFMARFDQYLWHYWSVFYFSRICRLEVCFSMCTWHCQAVPASWAQD